MLTYSAAQFIAAGAFGVERAFATAPSLIVPLIVSPLTVAVTLMSSGLPFSMIDQASFTSSPLTVPLTGVSP